MTESHGADPPLEPPRPMWAVEPETAYERRVTTPPPKRRRRWLRELPYVVIGVIVVGTIVTCGITQIFGDDELVAPGTAAGDDCFNLGPYPGVPGHVGLPEDMRDAVHPVSCVAPHTFETYRRGRFVGADADAAGPDLARNSAQVIKACFESARHFLGGDYAHARVVLDIITPTTQGWAAGERWYACVLAEVDSAFGGYVKGTDSLRDGLAGGRPLAIGCVDLGMASGQLNEIDYVSCGAPHSGEFVGAHAIEQGDAYPDTATMDAIVDGLCLPLVTSYLGLTADQFDARKDLAYVWSMADEQGWRAGDRSVRCFVATSDYKRVITDSIKGIGTALLPRD